MSEGASPFRKDALALASTDAAPLLAKWSAEPLPMSLRLAMLVVGRPYRALRTEESVGKPDVLASAEVLGLERLGTFTFAGLIPFFGPVRECWADRGRVVRISMRRAAPRGPVEATMGTYILSTYFDDGSAIVTYTHPFTGPRDERMVTRVGTGDLADDYRAHLAAVMEYAGTTRHPLRIADLDTALALSTSFDTRVAPWAFSSLARARLFLLGVVVIGLVLLARSWPR